jgi:hypothetical protein
MRRDRFPRRVNPLTVVGGLILLFFAPGFTLLHALFPGRRYFGPFHPFAMPLLSVIASVAVLIVVGSTLAFTGLFWGNQTGAPILELVLGTLSVALFIIAWYRGALPLLGRKAEYANPQERGEPEEVTLLRDMRLEQERLRREIARVRKRARESRDTGVRTALTEAADDLEKERAEIAERAADLERRAGERRYGRKDEKPRFAARGK